MEEKHEISVNGCIETPKDVTEDDVMNAIIELCESKGWLFGGGVAIYTGEGKDT